MGVTFDVLLAAATAEDIEAIDSELGELEDEEKQLSRKLKKVRHRKEELRRKRAVPLRAAVRAAKQLGVEIPRQYRNLQSTPGNTKAKVRYQWEAAGCRTKTQTVSEAMWRLSKGSGGSGGNNGQGVLLTDEFWPLVQKQLGKQEHEIEDGEELTVTLPNDRVVTFKRVE